MLTYSIVTLSSILPTLSNSNNWENVIFSTLLLSFLVYISIYSQSNLLMNNPIQISDTLTNSIITLSLWVTSLILINSIKIFNLNSSPNLFSSICSALLIALMLFFSASDFIMFFMIFEVSLVPTLLLVLLWGYQPERLQASIYLMLYTTSASLPLLTSILIMNSTLSIETIIWPIPPITTYAPAFEISWWIFCLAAFFVNIPIFLSHLWLPKAHVEAPVAGSIILAGVLLNLGGYGILRFHLIFPYLLNNVNFIVASISIIGALYTSIICSRQPDIKSLIAYASVSHIGLILASLLLFSSWSITGSLIIIVAHGLVSSWLFSLANTMYESSNTRSLLLSAGTLSVAPSMSLWLFLAIAANISAPPSINLAAEIPLLINLITKSWIGTILISITSFYTAVYSLNLFSTAYHNQIPEFSNLSSISNPLSSSSSIIHLAPVALFIMNPETLTSWL